MLAQRRAAERDTTPSYVALQHTRSITGPLPTPDALADYNRISPGLADRIVKMAEDEAAARRDIEKGILIAQTAELRGRRIESRYGQVCAAIVAIVGLSWAGHVSVAGQPWASTALGGGTLATIVTAFLYRRREQFQADAATPPPDPDRDPTRPETPSLSSLGRPAEPDATAPPS